MSGVASIGIDVGGTKVLGVLCQGPDVLRKAVRETGDDPGSAVLKIIKSLSEDGPVAAVGLALAAWVSLEGEPVFSPNIARGPEELRAQIEAEHGPVTAVENDASAAAWGEYRYGAGVDAPSLVVVTVGTGIGGGIVAGGELWRGNRGFAGEFGHMTVDVDGPPCACGLRGCLESLASGSAIQRMGREKFHSSEMLQRLSSADPSMVTAAMVADAAGAGDEISVAVMREAGHFLGIGLYGLAMAFDPSVIVVGGGVAGAGDIFIEPAKEQMGRMFEGKAEPVPVLAARLGNDAGAIGVASLAEDRMEA